MSNLSTREFEVNEQIARGYSVKEIASNLYLSPYTVDTHIKNIKKKTGARNMADLTRDFILSLDRPKQFFRSSVATFFLAIQLFICVYDTDSDLRKPLRSRTKIVRLARKTS